jgi:hypothetical protein
VISREEVSQKRVLRRKFGLDMDETILDRKYCILGAS